MAWITSPAGEQMCPTCGYGLTGLAPVAGKVRCPECGAEHEIARVAFITPWPARWRVLAWLAGPTTVLGVLAPVLASFEQTAGAGFVFQMIEIMSGALVPFISAGILVVRHIPECNRTRPLLLLVVGGWVLNAGLMCSSAGLGWAIQAWLSGDT